MTEFAACMMKIMSYSRFLIFFQAAFCHSVEFLELQWNNNSENKIIAFLFTDVFFR